MEKDKNRGAYKGTTKRLVAFVNESIGKDYCIKDIQAIAKSSNTRTYLMWLRRNKPSAISETAVLRQGRPVKAVRFNHKVTMKDFSQADLPLNTSAVFKEEPNKSFDQMMEMQRSILLMQQETLNLVNFIYMRTDRIRMALDSIISELKAENDEKAANHAEPSLITQPDGISNEKITEEGNP